LETTGIDDRTCAILEIATVITDKELEIVEMGPDLVIHQPEDVLRRMNAWCVKQHTVSGLTEESRRSPTSLAEAEQSTLQFVRRHCRRGWAPLSGNSVGFDRRFIMHHMPTLNAYLDFRNVDVSSIRELARRWYPDVVASIDRESSHRAMDDVLSSIEELRSYRRRLFSGETGGE